VPARRATALLPVCLVLLAGCTALGIGGLPTAKQADGIAAPAARAWQADALPVFIDGVETRMFHRVEGDLLVSDDAVGDGRAALWYVQYSSAAVPDADAAFLVANGTVAHNETRVTRIEDRASVPGGPSASTIVQFNFHPIRDWRLDSNDVVRVAAENNGVWRRIAASPTYLGFSLFGGNGTDPVWVAGITNRNVSALGHIERGSPGELAVVFVNATSGYYMDQPPAWMNDLVRVDTRASAGPDSGPGRPSVPPPPGLPEEKGSFRGTLTLVDDASHAFALASPGHPSLVLTLRAGDVPQTVGTVRAALTDAEGNVYEGAVANPGAAPQELLRVTGPLAGPYQLRLELVAGVLLPYEVAWVAEGTPAALRDAPHEMRASGPSS
jgi:hypothetical protein